MDHMCQRYDGSHVSDAKVRELTGADLRWCDDGMLVCCTPPLRTEAAEVAVVEVAAAAWRPAVPLHPEVDKNRKPGQVKGYEHTAEQGKRRAEQMRGERCSCGRCGACDMQIDLLEKEQKHDMSPAEDKIAFMLEKGNREEDALKHVSSNNNIHLT